LLPFAALICWANAGVIDAIGADIKASAPTTKARTPSAEICLSEFMGVILRGIVNDIICAATTEEFVFFFACRLVCYQTSY
jgi:hypothetical protein